MHYPLTINDFLYRAENVFPKRLAAVDEPSVDHSWGPQSYEDFAARTRSLGAALDELEVPPGGRVAIVSPNSARMLASFYGVSGHGRVLVPINFRLGRSEIEYIVDHSGADVLLVDPSVRTAVDGLQVPHTFVFGEDDWLWSHPGNPEAVGGG